MLVFVGVAILVCIGRTYIPLNYAGLKTTFYWAAVARIGGSANFLIWASMAVNANERIEESV